MMAGDALLVCDDLVIGYRGRPLLPPLSLEIRRGRMVIVVGRNGAGKSTWLKTVLGLTPPVRGRVRLISSPAENPARNLTATDAAEAEAEAEAAAKIAPKIAYVPQQAKLDELLPVNAHTVVGWGQLRGWSFLRPLSTGAERLARRRALQQTGAADLASQPFRDLSGGQRQRVLFARLLVDDLDLALLDEPTASMDMAGERRAYEQMAELARERDMAVVVVTHTISEAAHWADDVLFVDRGHGGGDGAVAFGPPAQVFAHPLFKHHFGELADHGE